MFILRLQDNGVVIQLSVCTIFRFLKCGNVVPLGQALAFLFSLPGLQEMLAILWSPWLALLLASAWNGGAHHSSPWVSVIVVPARSPRPPHLCPARQRLMPPVPHAQVVEELPRPGEAGDLTCLHPFIDASGGSDLIGWSPDLKGWDTWIQDVEKSLGEYRACLPNVINEMSFMDPPGNGEVVPKILQCDEDSAEM